MKVNAVTTVLAGGSVPMTTGAWPFAGASAANSESTRSQPNLRLVCMISETVWGGCSDAETNVGARGNARGTMKAIPGRKNRICRRGWPRSPERIRAASSYNANATPFSVAGNARPISQGPNRRQQKVHHRTEWPQRGAEGANQTVGLLLRLFAANRSKHQFFICPKLFRPFCVRVEVDDVSPRSLGDLRTEVRFSDALWQA